MSRLAYTADMAEERTDTHPGRIDEHYCEQPGCNKLGGLGYSPSKATPMRWWCDAHYPHWTEQERKRLGILPA